VKMESFEQSCHRLQMRSCDPLGRVEVKIISVITEGRRGGGTILLEGTVHVLVHSRQQRVEHV